MILPSNPLVLTGPSVLLVFSICFFLFWLGDRHKRYLLFLSAAIACFCLGLLGQIFSVPRHTGANAVFTALIFTLSVIMTCEGLLERSEKRTSLCFKLIYTTVICTGIAYFYFVERNLLIRIYILNFGFGLILAQTCYRLRFLRNGRTTERIFFWVFVVFTGQFFIRTLCTTQNVPKSGVGSGFPIFWFVLQFSVAVLGVALALSILAIIVDDKLEALERDRLTDHQTQLLNRRGFIKAAEKVLCSQSFHSHSVLLVDIDHFKAINDTYGHATGDIVISMVAKAILETTLPDSGIVCRWGGEEFSVLLRNYDRDAAYTVAENIRLQVTRATHARSAIPSVTVSIGVSTGRSPQTLAQLIDIADRALYVAKGLGRNRTQYQ